MRFIKAEVFCYQSEYSSRPTIQKVLYEELDNKAVLFIDDTGWGRRTSRLIDGEDYGAELLYLFIKDWAMDDKGIKALIEKSIKLLDLPDHKLIDVHDINLSEEYITNNCELFNDKRLMESASLHELLAMFRGNNKFFFDWIIKRQLKKDENFSLCNGTIHDKSLNKEIQRIYECTQEENDMKNGIPVHYALEGYEKNKYRNSLEVLLSSLVDSNRLLTNHIFKFNFDYIDENTDRPIIYKSFEAFLDVLNDNLANALCGNTVVIQYGLHDKIGNYNTYSYTAFCKFVEALKPYMEYTQVIFSTPYNNDDLLDRIQKLIDMPIANIYVDSGFKVKKNDYEGNLKYLKQKAKRNGLVADEKLENMLRNKLQDESFDDIDSLYFDWKQESRIENNFPQYKRELYKSIRIKEQQEPDAMKELDSLIGLKKVKKQIKDILVRFKMNEKNKAKGLPVQDFSMHMVFSGSPGTGKTIVAQLFGKILKEANVLDEGRVIQVSGAKFGMSVDELFKKAEGSVLFIDEAYDLIGTDHITPLIANMENYRDRVVVILAGYKHSMNVLLDRNPGFKSRIGFTLDFPDYSQDELLQIFKLMCKNANLKLSDEAVSIARDHLWRGGRRIDQGNGRFVRKYFEDAIGMQQVRLGKLLDSGHEYDLEELQTILPEDLVMQDLDKDGFEKLNDLIGLEIVKRDIRKRIQFFQMQRIRRDAGIKSKFMPMHMAFTGNPGTGKTQVAKYLGKILSESGILSVGDFYDCTPMDFAAPDAVKEIFDKAIGSVLFIDEAYSLTNFNAVVISDFMKYMEEYKNDVIVIFAGYTTEINKMLKSNPGFQSRITSKIEFPNYTKEELLQIIKYMAKKQNYSISRDAMPEIKKLIDIHYSEIDFGNARFVRNILDQAIVNQSARLLDDNNSEKLTVTQMKKLIPEDFSDIVVKKNDANKIGF